MRLTILGRGSSPGVKRLDDILSGLWIDFINSSP